MPLTFISNIGRLWRTARHLRRVQIFGRIRFRLARPKVSCSPPPGVRLLTGRWIRPAARNASLIGPTRFRLLNQEMELAEVGWDDPVLPKLWRYNQHYFDDLAAEGWAERRTWHRELVARWIHENPPAAGSGWESYPTSLRIINWIKWSLAGENLSSEAQHSLAVQIRWLTKRLEWHLLGNHLFVNAKALVFAGAFFEGREAESWLRVGLSILKSQLDEQFLTDGAQFELSPMYHALALEDLLDLLNLAAAFPGKVPAPVAEQLRSRANGAIAWLRAMSHPDGEISFFNDAAFGVAPSNEKLLAYAARLGFTPCSPVSPLTQLTASGYSRLAAGPAVLLVDHAHVGPDYLPGHAHADTLSFELSLFGQRVFVNSGTSEYGESPERLRQRGTAAHNTVVVAGENSSEVWGGFRVGRRARPYKVCVAQSGSTFVIEASHDGYTHLPGRPEHHRRFTLSARALQIEDYVTGQQPAHALFHLHPLIHVGAVTADRAILDLPDGRRATISTEGAALRTETGSWHPEFGRVERTTRLVIPLEAGRAVLSLSWDS